MFQSHLSPENNICVSIVYLFVFSFFAILSVSSSLAALLPVPGSTALCSPICGPRHEHSRSTVLRPSDHDLLTDTFPALPALQSHDAPAEFLRVPRLPDPRLFLFPLNAYGLTLTLCVGLVIWVSPAVHKNLQPDVSGHNPFTSEEHL